MHEFFSLDHDTDIMSKQLLTKTYTFFFIESDCSIFKFSYFILFQMKNITKKNFNDNNHENRMSYVLVSFFYGPVVSEHFFFRINSKEKKKL